MPYTTPRQRLRYAGMLGLALEATLWDPDPILLRGESRVGFKIGAIQPSRARAPAPF
jgi:hypothetical protein